MKLIIKLLLSILLFGCLARMPYGYYQFVRIAVCIGLIALAYMEYEAKRPVLTVLCVAGAILFNPVKKIALGRDNWQTVDLVIACLLILWLLFDLYSTYVRKKG